MEELIVKVNIKSTDLKAELSSIGYDVTGWDTSNEHYSSPELEINWIGPYIKTNPVTSEVVHSFPQFQFALIKWKGEGELDLKGNNKLEKFKEEGTAPLRRFL